MNTIKKYDLIVIGGGPAGYAAAIRAGQLGKRTACIESKHIGGICLNWGCIPSKALLKTAELYESIVCAEKFGIFAKNIKKDFSKIIDRSRNVVSKMSKGIEFLFKKNKIEYFAGYGQLHLPGVVEVISNTSREKYLRTNKILIATGSQPKLIPKLKIDGERIMTYRNILENKKQPKSIVILGAGAIGVEFAYFLNALGTKVTLIEILPKILPHEDEEISSTLQYSLQNKGITIYTNTKVKDIKINKENILLNLSQENKSINLKVENVLVAIGVIPNTKFLTSKNIYLDIDQKGFINVNNNYETNIKDVYAAGDVIGPPWLAHVAINEGIQAVNNIFETTNKAKQKVFPSCTYCQPQIASIGLTEIAAKEKGINYSVGKFPFLASGKAVAVDQTEGFVKLIADKKYGEVIGAHIIGHNATEMIAEVSMAINLEATVDEISQIIHAHPTFSEAIMEAASFIKGEAIHL